MLITHGQLVTKDQDNRVIPNGAVRILGDRIVDVGSTHDLLARHPDDDRMDATGLVVMPGMVCPNTQLAQVLLHRAAAVGESQRPLLFQRLEEELDHEAIRYSALLGCVEAIRAGTTTCIDRVHSHRIRHSLDAVAEATLQVGLRACLSYSVDESRGIPNARLGVQENAGFAKSAASSPLLAAAMGLGPSSLLSDDTLMAAVGSAALAGIGFSATVARTVQDVRTCEERHGLRPVERLRRAGVLGRRTMAVHCVYVIPYEMSALSEAGCAIIHSPRAGRYLAPRLAPIAEFLRRGMRVCLGSDGYSTDLVAEMRAALLIHTQSAGDPRAVRADSIERMALSHNADLASSVFGDTIGQLTPGALADVILVRYPAAELLDEANLSWHLVEGSGPLCVDTTIVGGHVLIRHGTLTTIDEAAVLSRAFDIARQLLARAQG